MESKKQMIKYGVKVYDDDGNLLHEQTLHGSKDFALTLGYYNKNFPGWFKYTITKLGVVEDYER